ncbi:hypothetical protein K469DRAFT_5371 [Zopfia rhizophila CBS 207.26]|uniref:Transmembrane protein n=1 Tax=Zopfia rhizophila CBS 207.26 TaxID=1314779 RepID=A0A6A6EYK5_9PEZI|nr:hypothetical protein K469DRAFT_5371 [Zopfia rhizophila CBS 207.26]
MDSGRTALDMISYSIFNALQPYILLRRPSDRLSIYLEPRPTYQSSPSAHFLHFNVPPLNLSPRRHFLLVNTCFIPSLVFLDFFFPYFHISTFIDSPLHLSTCNCGFVKATFCVGADVAASRKLLLYFLYTMVGMRVLGGQCIMLLDFIVQVLARSRK